jgi:hypothetical protein
LTCTRVPTRIESDSPLKESSSFLKKRTKKPLFYSGRCRLAGLMNQKFFVSFFQKRNTSLLRRTVRVGDQFVNHFCRVDACAKNKTSFMALTTRK